MWLTRNIDHGSDGPAKPHELLPAFRQVAITPEQANETSLRDVGLQPELNLWHTLGKNPKGSCQKFRCLNIDPK